MRGSYDMEDGRRIIYIEYTRTIASSYPKGPDNTRTAPILGRAIYEGHMAWAYKMLSVPGRRLCLNLNRDFAPILPRERLYGFATILPVSNTAYLDLLSQAAEVPCFRPLGDMERGDGREALCIEWWMQRAKIVEVK